MKRILFIFFLLFSSYNQLLPGGWFYNLNLQPGKTNRIEELGSRIEKLKEEAKVSRVLLSPYKKAAVSNNYQRSCTEMLRIEQERIRVQQEVLLGIEKEFARELANKQKRIDEPERKLFKNLLFFNFNMF
ncbi:hypothetical protein KAW80_00235 [Candidatus Babeliales bacterium]|nr:hypothetical protein [Candidatus Babeliales bacterium]